MKWVGTAGCRRNGKRRGTWSLGNPDGIVAVVEGGVVHVADTQVPTRSHQPGQT